MNNTYTNTIISELQDKLDTTIVEKNIKKNNPLIPNKQYFKQGTYQYLTTRSIDFDNIPYNKNHKIFLCIYRIQHTDQPFLEYLLYKYPKSECDLCIFPYLRRNPKKEIKTQLIDFFKSTINIPHLKWTTKGYILEGNNIYLLINIPRQVTQREHILRRESEWWWGMIDEICNQRHIVNFPIHESVTNLFLKNHDLIYLRDETGKKIPIPRALYYGTYSPIAPFYFVFGPKQTVSGRYGPYYYLGSYEKIIRYAGWSPEYTPIKKNNIIIADDNGKLIEGGGIIRYAVFLGKIKVLLNHPHDKKNIDVSLKNTLEFQLRLEDRDGEWATHYDSLYYGRANIKSASPKYWRANPGFVTKNFNQQIPLSMHILDTKTLKTNWDPHYYKYYIQ